MNILRTWNRFKSRNVPGAEPLSAKERILSCAGAIIGLLLAGALCSLIVGCSTSSLKSSALEWWNSKPPAVEPGELPPPAPTPAPQPAPVPSVDAIPINEVTWHHASPAAFAVTATLSNVRILEHGSSITWTWTHPDYWREEDGNTGGVVGNMWVFAKIKGRWHAATFEWLRRNTVRSNLEAKPGEPPFIQASAYPLNAWRPASSEEVGFMSSTMCRAGIPPQSVRQRSPIVLVRWP